MKQVRFFFEAIALYTFFGICALLPPATASNFGGFLARLIGPLKLGEKRALDNLKVALPGNTPEQNKEIIKEMWDNLGRVMGEYPHLEKIGKSRTAIQNTPTLETALNNRNGGVFIAGHLANWEVSAPTLLAHYNTALHLTYRAPNNPYSDWLLKKARTLNGRIPAFPKARASAKDLMATLKKKEFLGILVDQKFNEGVAIPFFGRPAMTNNAFVVLAQKYGCPLIPVQTVRTGPAQFDIIVHDLIPTVDNNGTAIPVNNILNIVHRHLEGWIMENPGQWLWLHRRWGSIAPD